jgi:hypothetical protein
LKDCHLGSEVKSPQRGILSVGMPVPTTWLAVLLAPAGDGPAPPDHDSPVSGSASLAG